MESSLLLSNSPIEFIFTGPLGGRDHILVKSANAGLDLIGLAAQPGVDPRESTSSDVLALIFGKTRQLNIVSSIKSPDLRPEADARESRFSFAWVGYASRLGVRHVEESLNLQLPDIYEAIRDRRAMPPIVPSDQKIQDIEWALGPVIYRCTEANERRLRSRRLVWATSAIYLGLGFLALVFEAILKLGLVQFHPR